MSTPNPHRYTLDTSAILAFRSDEHGSDKVEKILRQAEAGKAKIFISFMSQMELLYIIARIG